MSIRETNMSKFVLEIKIHRDIDEHERIFAISKQTFFLTTASHISTSYTYGSPSESWMFHILVLYAKCLSIHLHLVTSQLFFTYHLSISLL